MWKAKAVRGALRAQDEGNQDNLYTWMSPVSTAPTGSYQHDSNGWTLTVTRSSLGSTMLMMSGHGHAYELVHPTGDPFDIKAKGYEIHISKKTKDPGVMWKRSMRESSFVWLTFAGLARWVDPDLTAIDLIDPL